MTVHPAMPLAGPPVTAGREVAARLGFRAVGGRTHLAEQRTPHPFHITRPFRFAGDPEGMATLYLQSSSGGLYGDDRLSLDIAAGPRAAAHVTTQASSIVHHARGGETRVEVRLAAGEDALLEYCPDPAILFAGARLDAQVVARLGPGARLVLADAALTHDPAGIGAPFDRYRNEIRIETTDGAPLLIDRGVVAGADWHARCGGWPCLGTMIVAGAIDARAVGDGLRGAIDQPIGGAAYAAVSVFEERRLVLLRVLATDGAALSTALETGWSAARTGLTGHPPRRRPK